MLSDASSGGGETGWGLRTGESGCLTRGEETVESGGGERSDSELNRERGGDRVLCVAVKKLSTESWKRESALDALLGSSAGGPEETSGDRVLGERSAANSKSGTSKGLAGGASLGEGKSLIEDVRGLDSGADGGRGSSVACVAFRESAARTGSKASNALTSAR
jgi:hypothetical protein